MWYILCQQTNRTDTSSWRYILKILHNKNQLRAWAVRDTTSLNSSSVKLFVSSFVFSFTVVDCDGHLEMCWLLKLISCRIWYDDYFLTVWLKSAHWFMRHFANTTEKQRNSNKHSHPFAFSSRPAEKSFLNIFPDIINIKYYIVSVIVCRARQNLSLWSFGALKEVILQTDSLFSVLLWFPGNSTFL